MVLPLVVDSAALKSVFVVLQLVGLFWGGHKPMNRNNVFAQPYLGRDNTHSKLKAGGIFPNPDVWIINAKITQC